MPKAKAKPLCFFTLVRSEVVEMNRVAVLLNQLKTSGAAPGSA
jgi:hypothetical protein